MKSLQGARLAVEGGERSRHCDAKPLSARDGWLRSGVLAGLLMDDSQTLVVLVMEIAVEA